MLTRMTITNTDNNDDNDDYDDDKQGDYDNNDDPMVMMMMTQMTITMMIIRSLSNDDGDGNENGSKPIDIDWKNNNFARASLFFAHSFVVIACEQQTHFRSERSDDRKCVCCSQAIVITARLQSENA